MPSPKRDLPARQPRVKSAKSRAKAQANVVAAAARLADLQRKQKMVAEARKAGLTGSDHEIVETLFVRSVLTGSNGEKVKRFLGQRVNDAPVRIAEIVRNFCRTQGFPTP